MDDDELLSNIIVISGKDKMSLRDMKYRRFPENSGNLQSFPIEPDTYITSELATEKLEKLQGVLYYNTPKQYQSLLFYVFDISTAQSINLKGLGTVNTTIVFLNTNTTMSPTWSTKITNWSQDRDAVVSLYPGIPQDGQELINTQIFSNPMHSDGFDGYFKNVEPFSLSLLTFHLKSYKGCSFNIEPGTVSVDDTTTTAYTTTGFYMKQIWETDKVTRINTMKDNKSLGVIGANILGFTIYQSTVSFLVNDGAKILGSQTTIPTDFFAPWSTPNVGSEILINSTNAISAEYYVQYCVVQGPGPNTVAPTGSTVTSTTSRHVETTTKLSGATSTILAVLFLLISMFS